MYQYQYKYQYTYQRKYRCRCRDYLTLDRAICWWTVGHGFAYGKDAGGFIGTSDFAFANSDLQFQEEGINFAKWFFHWAFAGKGTQYTKDCTLYISTRGHRLQVELQQ